MKKKEMLNKIKELEEKYEKQQEVLEFLTKHGKDGIETEIKGCYYWLYKRIKKGWVK